MWRQTLPLRCAPVVLALVATESLAAQGPLPVAPQTSGDPVLARVNGEAITAGQVEEAILGQLATLEEQTYRLKRKRIDVLIDQRLLAIEAARQGLSREALAEKEITAKAGAVSDLEIEAYHRENKVRLPNLSGQVRHQIRNLLQQRKWDARAQQFAAQLRAAADIDVLFPEPRLLRTTVSAEGRYARGPRAAPVTIVGFTDFHCPFSRRVHATLELVLTRYGDRVRFVHRDFPIDRLHPAARQAHEAARCAGEQDQFWEYYDALLSAPPVSGVEQLTGAARALELDAGRLEECLASRRHRDPIDSDITEGQRAGTTATPTVFINGRRLQGARSFESFARVIDEELARAADGKARGQEPTNIRR